MKVQRLNVKVFASARDGYDPGALIPVFHDWIRGKVLEDRLMIDVADYRHVEDGPGVALVTHEAIYSLDEEGGRLGLLCARRRDEPTELADALPAALRDALRVSQLLEQEERLKGLRFDGGELVIRVQSRLLAPNDAQTRSAFDPVLRECLKTVYAGAPVEVGHLDDPREAFGVRVKASGGVPLADLLSRLAA